MFGALDISTSALVAQRVRANTISANMANANSIYNAEGEYEPYRRQIVVFAPGDTRTGNKDGVHVQKIMMDDSPLKMTYNPTHPDADDQGYLAMPNVDSTIEQVNMLEASRAYEANITAAEATKSIMQSSLRLLA
ncbi:flagellar basal body rod protein FlgC [Poriferisphaera sp. WC338]|uniref:flagellar basal body rod protein FlgC n=1 Tax=Poriferisphaera sp. WC338 TaxID=3425129 RepID=UPI003D812C0E